MPIGGSGLGTLLFFCAAFWTGDENLSFALRHIQNRAASFTFEINRGFTVNPLLIKKTPPSLRLHHRILVLGQLTRSCCDVPWIATENAQRHEQQGKHWQNAGMREKIHQNESASQKHQGLSQLVDAITTHHPLSHTIFEIAVLAKTCHKNNQPNFPIRNTRIKCVIHSNRASVTELMHHGFATILLKLTHRNFAEPC